MVPPFVPADATVGVVPGEGTGGGDFTGTGDAPGGGLDSSHVDGDTTHSLRWEAGPMEMRKLEEEQLLLPLSASSSDLLRLMVNLPAWDAYTGHSLSCWR